MGRAFIFVLALALVVRGGTPSEVKAAVENLKSRDVKARRRGAMELARLGPAATSVAAQMIDALADEDERVRRDLLKALESIGADAVPDLVAALRHRDRNVRLSACWLLKKPRALLVLQPHVRRIAVVLSDRDATVRRAGVALFAAIQTPGVEALLQALRNDQPETRAAAAAALAVAGRGRVNRMRDLLQTSASAHQREGICIALGRMGKVASPASEALVRSLGDRKPEVQSEAARALGRIGAAYDQAGSALCEGLASEAQRVREGCIDGLAAYGAVAVSDLLAQLASVDARTHEGAQEALCRMEEPPRDALLLALRGPDGRTRIGAIQVLVRLARGVPDRAARPGLIKCLSAAGPDLREAAAAALGELVGSQVVQGEGAEPAAVLALMAAATDKAPRVRAAALASLGRLGSAAARPVIEKSRNDKDAGVRINAEVALWGIGGDATAAVEALRRALAAAETCAAAAKALGDMHIAAEPCIPALVALLANGKPEHRRAAAEALGRIVRPGRASVVQIRGKWREEAPADVRKAIAAGLAWLAKNQDEETGGWDCDEHGGRPWYDAGVTGLALWAMLGAGDSGSPAVRRGLDYLLGVQEHGGLIGAQSSHSYLCCHAVAGIALAEAWLLTADPRYARALDAAAALAQEARNPGLAWRYQPRGGRNDTHMTGWMVTFLRLSELGGVAVDPDAYAGAGKWLRGMTGPEFGQVGYDSPGGFPARPKDKMDAFPPENTRALTAVSVWCRHLIGGRLLTDKTCAMGADLCTECPPVTDLSYRDQYYHQFGALAVFQGNPTGWPEWNEAARATYLALQAEDGSWPPDGVWGSYGGRAYSTALAVLTLLAPYRYPRGFASEPGLQPAERQAVDALENAAKDDDPSVAAAAQEALRRIMRK